MSSEDRGVQVEARPQRIQRRRSKGWRMPEGAVYVGRPSRWGNPFRVGEPGWVGHWQATSPEHAVALFREFAWAQVDEIRADLEGRDLACWCRPGDPCHADVLLDLANPGLIVDQEADR